MKRILCIIPARGGSKGIPGKNLKKIDGKTLIEYAWASTHHSVNDLTVVLSSDDDAILKHAEDIGLETVRRPLELATDEAPVVAAVRHCLYVMEQRKEVTFDLIVLLQPTSPIRTSKDLDKVIALLDKGDVEGVISVVPSNEVHPARMYRLEDNKLLPLIEKQEGARRQEIAPVYYRNGCYYAVRRTAFLEQNTLMPEKKYAYIMPSALLCNIDEPVDLIIAEALIKAWKNNTI